VTGRRWARVAVVPLAVLALVPLTGDYAALVGSLAVVYALVALGFVVLTGWAGDVSLGQIVPFGLGAYATFALADRLRVPVGLAMLLAVVVTMPLVVAIGLPALRLRGLDLAVATLALALVFQLAVFKDIGRWLGPKTPALTEFSSSVVRVGRPHIGPVSLAGNRAFYVATVLAAAAIGALVAALGRSRFGLALRAVRDDPLRAEVLGVPVARYRLGAFVVAGAVAAFAGAIAASLRQAVTPETFTIFESLNFLAIGVIGGVTAAPGALLGGAFGAGLGELSRLNGFRFLQGRLTLVYGVGLVAVLAARPGGLASVLGWDRGALSREPSIRRPDRGPRSRGHNPAQPLGIETPAGPLRRDRERRALLRVDNVTVAFDAVRAVDSVSFTVGDGESVALIGPNGAGKTTLFDAITGLLPPDSGRIFFAGRDVGPWLAHRRAELGLARTFQTVRTFPGLTVRENLDVAAHLRPGGAGRLVDQLDLGAHADDFPRELAFGDLRALEVGLALASQPRLLLLDEPTAGLSPADAARLCDLLAQLRDELGETLLLVEHDMAVVGRLAERVIVLDRGAVIADGSPRQVANDSVVIASYLGTTAQQLRGALGKERARAGG
jgi:ABC-type branched-subunit amino acid transport system ATPase component/ABC-type branched-subunit amino acid transport system permease subunit